MAFFCGQGFVERKSISLIVASFLFFSDVAYIFVDKITARVMWKKFQLKILNISDKIPELILEELISKKNSKRYSSQGVNWFHYFIAN